MQKEIAGAIRAAISCRCHRRLSDLHEFVQGCKTLQELHNFTGPVEAAGYILKEIGRSCISCSELQVLQVL